MFLGRLPLCPLLRFHHAAQLADRLGRRPVKKRERLFLEPLDKRLDSERFVSLAVISGFINDEVVIGHWSIEITAHIIPSQSCFFVIKPPALI